MVKFHCKYGVFPSVSFVNGYVHLKLPILLSLRHRQATIHTLVQSKELLSFHILGRISLQPAAISVSIAGETPVHRWHGISLSQI